MQRRKQTKNAARLERKIKMKKKDLQAHETMKNGTHNNGKFQ